MNTLIIGSGFGLYGYLPSIYNFSKKIYLNKKYKNTLYKRKELKSYLDKVKWYSLQSKIISQIDYIVIAKRPQDQFKEIKDNNQIAIYYCNDDGQTDEQFNPNGSINNIAGIFNKEKNVLGMMPHPERMIDKSLSGEDGSIFFKNLINNIK